MLIAGQRDKVGLPRAPAIPLRPVGGGLKRALDIAVASSVLLLLLPLLAMTAVLVLATMGRPVFCRHNRMGFGGRSIGCYRFRAVGTDGRPTPLGALLMRAGIDNLPQLLNVIKGEMSCVGPRALTADELQGSEASSYLSARPGMAGTWQLGRDAMSSAGAAALDSAYVHDWSMQSDIRILLKSIPAIARAEDRA